MKLIFVLLLAGSFVYAATLTSLVGDIDGYNGKINPYGTFPIRFNFTGIAANSGADPAYQDAQYFAESSAQPVYSHTFSLPTGAVISSIVYDIVTFDNCASNDQLFFDGVEVRRNSNAFFYDANGEYGLGADGSFEDGCAEKFSFVVPTNLFYLFTDGSVAVKYVGLGGGDCVAIDYSLFTITYTVPEPSSIVLCVLAGLLMLLSKKARK